MVHTELQPKEHSLVDFTAQTNTCTQRGALRTSRAATGTATDKEKTTGLDWPQAEESARDCERLHPI